MTMHELGRMKQANVGNIIMKFTAVFVWFVLAGVALGEPSKTQNAFRVKYILSDAVYIDGGKPSGLAEGQRLIIRRKAASEGSGVLPGLKPGRGCQILTPEQATAKGPSGEA